MNIRLLTIMITPYDSSRLYGAELSCLALISNLSKMGVEVFLIHRSSTVIDEKASALKTIKVQGTNFQILRFTLAAIKAAINTKCDLIYAYHADFEPSLVPAFFAGLVTRKNLILGILDDWMKESDTQPLLALLVARITARKGVRSTIDRMFFHIMRRLACKTASACLTPSFSVANYAKRTLHASRVHSVGRGVDDLWFSHPNSSPIYDAIYVGRLDRKKGIDTLINAWRFVVNEKKDARLVIVGSAVDPDYENFVRGMVEARGLTCNIIFTGYIEDSKKICELLSSSKLFVFPSKKEGFARAVAEAMATGLPCVLSDIPVFRELYGRVALFAVPNDSESYAQIILELLNNEEKRLRLGEESGMLAREMNWEEVSRKTLNIMNSIHSHSLYDTS